MFMERQVPNRSSVFTSTTIAILAAAVLAPVSASAMTVRMAGGGGAQFGRGHAMRANPVMPHCIPHYVHCGGWPPDPWCIPWKC
jgi:hypothetical protein